MPIKMKKYFSLKKEKKTLSVQKTDQCHLTTMTGRFPFTLKVSFDLFFCFSPASPCLVFRLFKINLPEGVIFYFIYVFRKWFNLCVFCVSGLVWVVPVLLRVRQL